MLQLYNYIHQLDVHNIVRMSVYVHVGFSGAKGIILNMLSLASVGVIMFTIVGTMTCHILSSYVYKRTWPRKYSVLTAGEKCNLDRHFGTTIAGMLCFAFALKAFISDPDFHQLGLVGSSATGNVALDIAIGQCVSDLLYHRIAEGTYGSNRSVWHHSAVIIGIVVAHKLFHRISVYRFIHFIVSPFLMVYYLMRKLEYINSGLFKYVMLINLSLYFLFRIAVIPFHWAWYIYEIVYAKSDWSQIWPPAWIVLIMCNILIDCINCLRGRALFKNYQEIMETKERED